MATISTGGGGQGGKRALDSEIPLIPFIDLLLCCVMFLLVTAVWNQLASVQAHLNAPASESSMLEPRAAPAMVVLLESTRFVVSSDVGDRTEITFAQGAPDLEALRAHLEPRRAATTGEIVVAADDGIAFESVIATMDTLVAAGFDRVTMGDGR
ncbi:MAG: biopolymer transporter ExbD [Myxococcota bacterium]|nr:biopolymer transporter ExbD [Myxococcota bacterium]